MQSPTVNYNVPSIHAAGWQLSKALSPLRASTVEQLRAIRADTLAEIPHPIRAVNDGVFFLNGWRETLFSSSESDKVVKASQDRNLTTLLWRVRKLKSRSRSPHPHGRALHALNNSGLQPLIIGDCASDSDLWSNTTSHWVASGVVRRFRAICQSLTKATVFLNANDIAPHIADKLPERVLELIEDARISWFAECLSGCSAGWLANMVIRL